MHRPSDIDDDITISEDVVLAMLAVYSYPLERMEKSRNAIRAAKLYDVRKLASSSLTVLTDELKAAHYDRGALTWQYADRLIAFGQYALQYGPEKLTRELRLGEPEEIRKVLTAVYGIGPKVIENFVELRRRRLRGAVGQDGE